MARNSGIPPESFEEILAWLDPDREVAGAIYVQLCHDLAQIFTWNRCSDPEGLTDEVIDRVSRKVHEVRKTYVGDPRHYFHGVARNLIKEIRNRAKEQVPLEDIEVASANPAMDTGEEMAEMREECLDSCLASLSPEKRELILNYYAKDKHDKIKHRAELARRLGISVQTLRVRVYRIRLELQQCIERCLARMDQDK